jgi:peptidoglycan hydrolase-like protein with peptidoglycan-binding domain
MTGGGVRALQQRMKDLGYYSGSVDGDFGAGTQAAVIAFQTANGLTADGVAGKSTLNALYGGSSGGGGSGTNPDSYGTSASTNGYSTIASGSGSSTANITALQSALSSTGYYSGTLDGDFGSVTIDAVKNYQSAKGLRVTGMAGPTTQRLLYGGTAESGSYSKLQSGSSGTAVKNLQYTLYELKYYDGNITGTYDDATLNAVMLFQEVNGLTADGVAGEQTQRRLYSSNAVPNNR